MYRFCCSHTTRLQIAAMGCIWWTISLLVLLLFVLPYNSTLMLILLLEGFFIDLNSDKPVKYLSWKQRFSPLLLLLLKGQLHQSGSLYIQCFLLGKVHYFCRLLDLQDINWRKCSAVLSLLFLHWLRIMIWFLFASIPFSKIIWTAYSHGPLFSAALWSEHIVMKWTILSHQL